MTPQVQPWSSRCYTGRLVARGGERPRDGAGHRVARCVGRPADRRRVGRGGVSGALGVQVAVLVVEL